MSKLVDFCNSVMINGKSIVAEKVPVGIELTAEEIRKAMDSGYMVIHSGGEENRLVTIMRQGKQAKENLVAEKEATKEDEALNESKDPFGWYTPPSCLGDVLTLLNGKKTCNILFYGPTQCGKSVAVDWISHKLGRKSFYINCCGQMKKSDFFGQNTVVIDKSVNPPQNKVVFVKGVVEQAATMGLNEKGEVVGPAGILFIDEAASIPSEIAISLNHVLETNKNVREFCIPEDGGRVVKSHPDFRIILAANTNLTGANTASSQLYTAQKRALDASVCQRISYIFRFGYDRKAEETIISRNIKDKKIKDYFLTFKQNVRDNLKSGKLITPFSTKKIIDICDMYRTFVADGSPVMAMAKAVYYTTYESLMTEERITYDELFKPLFNVKVSAYAGTDDCDYL